MRARPAALLGAMSFLGLTAAFAAEQGGTSAQPYIDSIRSELPEESARPSLEEERRRLREEKPEEGSYIEKLKSEDPESFKKPENEGTYLEEKRRNLDPKESGGAIQALHEGRSELKPRFEGEIHHAFGFRIGATADRSLSGDAVARSFESVYGSGFAPDLTLFYEYQPFRSEWAGNIGLYGSLGASYFSGKGAFQYLPKKAWDGMNFPEEARTGFKFFIVPVSLGLDYRFNLFHFIRPYVIAAPTAIAYFETRSDEVEGHRGYSKALFMAGGASILLDWISSDGAWDQYTSNNVRHTYLTVEYSRYDTIAGDLDFSISGLSAGILFEY
ncbi:MAG: hypothetical protein NDJ89_03345 [Oligoflexia bacterium]|nr:hypothetical protein [Oligoflexia bacterium]